MSSFLLFAHLCLCVCVCVCVCAVVFVLGLYEHVKKNKVYSRDSGFVSFFLFPVAIFISVS
jgi:hypothetical protein